MSRSRITLSQFLTDWLETIKPRVTHVTPRASMPMPASSWRPASMGRRREPVRGGVVFFDASVLFKAAVTQSLLGAAQSGEFRAIWSELVVSEARRNLLAAASIEKRPASAHDFGVDRRGLIVGTVREVARQ